VSLNPRNRALEHAFVSTREPTLSTVRIEEVRNLNLLGSGGTSQSLAITVP
jgi:hypothetical protein